MHHCVAEIILGATTSSQEDGISPGLNIDANWMLGLTTFGMFLPFDPRVVAQGGNSIDI